MSQVLNEGVPLKFLLTHGCVVSEDKQRLGRVSKVTLCNDMNAIKAKEVV